MNIRGEVEKQGVPLPMKKAAALALKGREPRSHSVLHELPGA